jgi:hypothetical protein
MLLNFSIFDERNLEILEYLQKTGNTEVFTSEVTLIIDYRWEKDRKGIIIVQFMYINYVAIIAVYLGNFYQQIGFMAVIIIFSSVLAIIELFQLPGTIRRFWNNQSNYQDYINISELISYFAYIVINILQVVQILQPEIMEVTSTQKNIEIFALSLILMRSVLILRVHDSTRYLFRMIFEVIKDMLAFLFILLFFQGLFSMVFKLMTM